MISNGTSTHAKWKEITDSMAFNGIQYTYKYKGIATIEHEHCIYLFDNHYTLQMPYFYTQSHAARIFSNFSKVSQDKTLFGSLVSSIFYAITIQSGLPQAMWPQQSRVVTKR